MEDVLYADILFFINFSMDFVTLYLTSRLTSGPPAGGRAVAAAVLGGIYGTAAIAAGIGGIAGVILTGAVSFIMVRLAFGGGGIGLLLRRCAVFWGTASLLGGVMTAICSLGGEASSAATPTGSTALLFAGSSVCLLFMRIFSRFSRQRCVRIRVCFNGREASFTALCDSGNLAVDPLSARPAIIADRSVMRAVVPELGASSASIPRGTETRIRMIPIKGVGGGGLLTGFIPDSVWVITGRGEKRCDAVIAVSDFGETFFGGHPANAPSAIL